MNKNKLIYIFPGIGSIKTISNINISSRIKNKYLQYIQEREINFDPNIYSILYHVCYLMSLYDDYLVNNKKPDIIIYHSLGLIPSLYASGLDWKKCIDMSMSYDEMFNNSGISGTMYVARNLDDIIKNNQIEVACYNTPNSFTLTTTNELNNDINEKQIISKGRTYHNSVYKNKIKNNDKFKFKLQIPILNHDGYIKSIKTRLIDKMWYTPVYFEQTIHKLLSIYKLDELEFVEIAEKIIILPMLLKWLPSIKIHNQISDISFEHIDKIKEIIKKYIFENFKIEIDNNSNLLYGHIGLKSINYISLVTIINNILGTNYNFIIFYKYPSLKSLNEQNKNTNMINNKRNEIYINGISCIFPGANNLLEYKKLIDDGLCHIGPINKVIFNNELFNIDKIPEIDNMDPQQKILLTMTHQCLLDAGFNDPINNLEGHNIGVFIGAWSNDYAVWGNRDSTYSATGRSNCILSARIAYIYGLTGPCMTIDTACSSSLVALDIAINYINLGYCESAIVGGVNLLLYEEMTEIMRKGSFLSPTNRCHTFSEEADGYVRAEGCGVIYISKNNINAYSQILSTFVNQDGKSITMTAPNPVAQTNLIKNAISIANIDSTDITYHECHGTGTKQGDPIELNALYDVFGKRDDLVIGSIKTQIGHTESAAGIAGIIKVILCLKDHRVPIGIKIKEKNKMIDWEKINYGLPDKEYNIGDIGSVCSFGFGGTNSVAIIKNIDNHEIKNNTFYKIEHKKKITL
jgi:3-oxoacyl-(acyl-carrier-protein) synthase